jgi:hypothetical protein
MNTKLNLFLTCLFVVFAFMAFEATATDKKNDDPKWNTPAPQSPGSYTTNNLSPKIDINSTLKSNIDNSAYSKSNAEALSKANSDSAAINSNDIDASSKSISKGGKADAQATASGGVGESNANVTMIQEQVRQAPIAFAPNMVPSYSQANCANSGSIGISTPFGAIAGGLPVDNDNCDRRLDSAYYQTSGLPRVACERMRQFDKNAEAMEAAGATCAEVTKTVVVTQAPTEKFVTQEQFQKALDNQHRVSMTK